MAKNLDDNMSGLTDDAYEQIVMSFSEVAALFEQNAKIYDIAGFAQLPLDEDRIVDAVTVIWNCTSENKKVLRREEYAAIMFALIRIAQNYYEAGTYWPHLDNYLPGSETFSATDHAVIGAWFRRGLKRFGYSVVSNTAAFNRAMRNVSPILIHAGIPSDSMHGLVQLVNSRQHYLDDDPSPADIAYVSDSKTYSHSSLHINVRRIFQSQLNVSADIWNSISTLIHAVHADDSLACEDVFNNLPLVFDQDELRNSVANLSRSTTGVHRRQPTITYDGSSGAILIDAYSDHGTTWTSSLASDHWIRTPRGMQTAILNPVANNIVTVESDDEDIHARTFDVVYEDSEVRMIWFNGYNGRLVERHELENNGFDPGRWILFVEGHVSGEDISKTVSHWEYKTGDWAAWAIDLPERTADQTMATLTIDGKDLALPLSMRPRPRLEFVKDDGETPLDSEEITASWDDLPVTVYATLPTIRHNGGRATTLAVDRIVSGGIQPFCRERLEPGDTLKIENCNGPQFLKIRDSRTVNPRYVAVLPGANFSKVIYSPDREFATVDATLPDGIGITSDYASVRPQRIELSGFRKIEISSRTVAPDMTMRCNLHGHKIDLTWPLTGLRWRVLYGDEDITGWSRELLYVDGTRCSSDTMLEVLIPEVDTFTVGESLETRFQETDSGFRTLIRVAPFRGPVPARITYEHVPTDFVPIFVVDRPRLNEVYATLTNDGVKFEGEGFLPEHSFAYVWPILSPDKDPIKTPVKCSKGKFKGKIKGDFQSGDFLFSIGTPIESLFESTVDLAEGTDGKTIFCSVFNSDDPESNNTKAFCQLVYQSMVAKRLDIASVQRTLADFIRDKNKSIDYNALLGFKDSLEQGFWLGGSATTATRRQELVSAVLESLNAGDWMQSFNKDTDTDAFQQLLRRGIYVGWFKPWNFRPNYVHRKQLPCPLQCYLDLWSISQKDGISANDIRATNGQRHSAVNRLIELNSDLLLPDLDLFMPLKHASTIELPASGIQPAISLTIDDIQTNVHESSATLGMDEMTITARDPNDRKYTLIYNPTHTPKGWSIEDQHGRIVAQPEYEPLSVHGFRIDRLKDGVQATCSLMGKKLPDKALSFLTERQRTLIDQVLSSIDGYDLINHAVWLEGDNLDIQFRGKTMSFSPAEHTALYDVWRVCWIDRCVTQGGQRHMFGRGGRLDLTVTEFLGLLLDMFQAAPRVMKSILALSELLYYTFNTKQHGGIGTSSRISSFAE